MKLLVVLPSRYARGPDDRVYTIGPHRYSFWQRYLEVFEEVLVLARVRKADRVDPSWAPADGPNVSFCDLPDYAGPWQYLSVLGDLKAGVGEAVAAADAYLLRSGGDAAPALAWREICRFRRPYAVEVIANPWENLGPGTVKTWTRPIGRRVYTRNLSLQCRHAVAVSYVTREALQRSYPASPDALTMGCSDVEMPDDAYVSESRKFSSHPVKLVHVGSLQHFIKGVDVLVRAVAECVKRGLLLRLRILGGGQRRSDLEALIRSLGIEDSVQLLGKVGSREDVIRELDDADLFLLPSRCEGLPRALIEAMGRALPCIGTAVGGIPELLPAEDMVPANDVVALADKILEVLRDAERLTRMSTRNLGVAREYRSAVLAPRRREFYQHLRTVSGG